MFHMWLNIIRLKFDGITLRMVSACGVCVSSFSYRIVQEHGGRIDVSSHVGTGTSITVSLPAPATMRHAVA